MRTLIDIDDLQIKELDRLAKDESRSRAAIIRQAISQYLEQQASSRTANAFGLWAGHAVDGLAFQEKARSEW